MSTLQTNLPNEPDKDFSLLGICVLIPTYNNAKTLGKTIEDVACYTKNILVVNDGSTDETEGVIESYPFLKSLSYADNKGKGWAIRKGFRLAVEQGYDYAITIDSDGQHFAKDLPAFISRIKSDGPAIVIGARNMNQESVPGKSSFGHKFSNFWFWVETGLRLPDTQSGFRLYPVKLLQGIEFFTSKYEFEIEVLVRGAWNGLSIDSIPVDVYYPPKGERVSHFRPFIDFTRISILNTFLVFVSFFYIKPRDFFSRIFQKKNGQEIIQDLFFNPGQSDLLLSVSVGFGIFMGIMPIWGFQLLLAVFLAIIFKMNKPLVILAANISVPPMIPLIIYCSYKLGAYWMPAGHEAVSFRWSLTLESFRFNFQQYIYGSITLAFLAGFIFLCATLILLKLFRRKTSPAV